MNFTYLCEKLMVRILDGGMGWLLQQGWSEEDILRSYVAAGADILTTDTLIPGRDAAAAVARARAIAGTGRSVIGSVGPTYCEENVREIAAAGVDALLFETICDLDAAVRLGRIAKSMGTPLMFSATLRLDGSLPCGATVREFAETMLQLNPLSIGLNCGFGPKHLVKHFAELGQLPCLKSLHPSAGMPGEYMGAKEFAEILRPLIEAGEADIVGGCCGTGPEHIAALNFLRRDGV